MTGTTGGFTLLELMVVTALIGIIAGVAVPNLVSSRAVANERAMIATLRTVSTAEAQVMNLQTLDNDHDGYGEALSLLELAGMVDMRGTSVRLAPTALSKSLGTLHASGFVICKGYLLGFYLPDASGTGVLCAPANFGAIDTDLSEQAWSCVAWPLKRGSTGTATYFVNQGGEVLVSRETNYSGPGLPPPGGAALVGVSATTVVGGTLAADTIGADGNMWRTIR